MQEIGTLEILFIIIYYVVYSMVCCGGGGACGWRTHTHNKTYTCDVHFVVHVFFVGVVFCAQCAYVGVRACAWACLGVYCMLCVEG